MPEADEFAPGGAHDETSNPLFGGQEPHRIDKDELSRAAFGIGRDEALAGNLCVQCKEPGALERCYSEAGRREYRITAMCEPCFDAMFGDEDDEDDGETPD